MLRPEDMWIPDPGSGHIARKGGVCKMCGYRSELIGVDRHYVKVHMDVLIASGAA